MTGFASRLSFARVLYSIQCGNAHPGCTIALSEAFLACVKGLCVQRSRPFASARGLVSEGSLPIARKEPAWIRHEKRPSAYPHTFTVIQHWCVVRIRYAGITPTRLHMHPALIPWTHISSRYHAPLR